MRGWPGSIVLLRPVSAAEAVRIYSQAPEATPLAGGTDLMVGFNAGQMNDRTILDLSRLDEWRRITRTKTGLKVGSLTTHSQIRLHPEIKRRYPLLVEACSTIGGIQIQNQGTLGGNIANASPAGDTFPALAVYEASVHSVSAAGRRTSPFLEIFAGVKKTNLAPGELIDSIELPDLPGRPARGLFRKIGTRAAQAISKTVAAGLLWVEKGKVKELRFALGSMAPTVRRLRTVESFLAGKKLDAGTIDTACRFLEQDVAPIDDVRSTREYRLEVSRRLLRGFLLGR